MDVKSSSSTIGHLETNRSSPIIEMRLPPEEDAEKSDDEDALIRNVEESIVFFHHLGLVVLADADADASTAILIAVTTIFVDGVAVSASGGAYASAATIRKAEHDSAGTITIILMDIVIIDIIVDNLVIFAIVIIVVIVGV